MRRDAVRDAAHRQLVSVGQAQPVIRGGTSLQVHAWIRGHWSIEARHFVRDVTFGEDRSRVRHGHAPQIMAACRNLCISLIHRTAATEIGARRRAFAYHPAQALALLLPKTRPA